MAVKRKRTRTRAAQEGSTSVAVEERGSTPQEGRTVNRDEATDTVAVHGLPETVARVRVGGSVTRNMGDFNSVKVEVTIEMPCIPTEEGLEACYNDTALLVDNMLNRELEAATS